ncbi:hypothetical protein ABW21_db0205891 [Orbilia brochopaga]|nr:hypothetical protein ABW21_db0205891 [Drechslerella brochopaga]
MTSDFGEYVPSRNLLHIREIFNLHPASVLAPDLFRMPDYFDPWSISKPDHKTIGPICDQIIDYSLQLLDNIHQALSGTMHYFFKLVAAAARGGDTLEDTNASARLIKSLLKQRLDQLEPMGNALCTTVLLLTDYYLTIKHMAFNAFHYRRSPQGFYFGGENDELRGKLNDVTRITDIIRATAVQQVHRLSQTICVFLKSEGTGGVLAEKQPETVLIDKSGSEDEGQSESKSPDQDFEANLEDMLIEAITVHGAEQ